MEYYYFINGNQPILAYDINNITLIKQFYNTDNVISLSKEEFKNINFVRNLPSDSITMSSNSFGVL